MLVWVLLHRSFSSLALVAKSLLFQPLALAIIFVGTFAFVGPWGDFPLNDDWSYATSTRTLVTTGSWKPIGQTGMTLITNAVWAAPFCSASHCSFDDDRADEACAANYVRNPSQQPTEKQDNDWGPPAMPMIGLSRRISIGSREPYCVSQRGCAAR